MFKILASFEARAKVRRAFVTVNSIKSGVNKITFQDETEFEYILFVCKRASMIQR